MCFSATLEWRKSDRMCSSGLRQETRVGVTGFSSAFVGMNERVSGVLQYTQRVATLSVSDRRLKSLSDHLHHRD